MANNFKCFGIGTGASVQDPCVIVGLVLSFGWGLNKNETLVQEDLRDLGVGH